MKYSLKWINEYVDIKEYLSDPQSLAKILTNVGLEVEEIDNAKEKFNKVVVGQVKERGVHPNADRLTLCQVAIGGGVVQQIVCGAKNHQVGDKVVVALPGAVLPGNFEIKISKIRGIESLGMLCSERELGLSQEGEGIVILDKEAPVGKPFAEYRGLDDIFFEIKVTPNRSDVNSHFGLAREIACVCGKEYQFPIKSFEESGGSTKSKIKLEIKDTQRCPRYTGRYIKGVKVAASPDWLKSRLESLGLNSINNIVDITNFVMLELGQPLHAFDADLIAGQKITVDSSKQNETFVSFDKTEVKLTGEELMIRDGERPVALAGIVGGLNSGVSEKTKNIFLESAYFTAASVRKTSRKFGIETDSGYRFSRGVDPDGVLLAQNRASEMIVSLAGGEIFSDVYDIYPERLEKKEVQVAIDFVAQQLSLDVKAEDFIEKIKKTGCKVNVQYDGIYLIKPPGFRHDLELEVDFIEEYARLLGYDHIPEKLPATQHLPTPHIAAYTNENLVHSLLQNQGFQQAINFAFQKSEFQKSFLGDITKLSDLGLPISEQPVEIKNPLSEDMNVMRTSLLPSLIRNLDFNYRHGNEEGRLYEIGFIFDGKKGSYGQESRLSFVSWGFHKGLWNSKVVPVVFELKSAIEKLILGLHSKSWTWQNVESAKVPEFMHPGQCASLFYEGKTIGVIGTLHPKISDDMKLRCDVAIGEINLDKLLQGQPKLPKFSKLPKFPAIDRDLAFVLPNKLTVGEVINEIKKAGGNLVKDIEVFDVFEGGDVPEGHKSVAFRYKVQDPENTLAVEALLSLQKKVIDSVSQKFSITTR